VRGRPLAATAAASMYQCADRDQSCSWRRHGTPERRHADVQRL